MAGHYGVEIPAADLGENLMSWKLENRWECTHKIGPQNREDAHLQNST